MLLALLRRPVVAERLPSGIAIEVEIAWREPNPFVRLCQLIAWDLGLAVHDKSLRPPGRRSAGSVALVADCIADQLPEQRKWPLVSEFLGPFIEFVDADLMTDPEHIRKLVVANKSRWGDQW